MDKWIDCAVELPPLNRYVVGFYNGGNWGDSDDPINVNGVVVKRVMVTPGRECPNNKRDYEYNTFGPSNFFGQDISHWFPLPVEYPQRPPQPRRFQFHLYNSVQQG